MKLLGTMGNFNTYPLIIQTNTHSYIQEGCFVVHGHQYYLAVY